MNAIMIVVNFIATNTLKLLAALFGIWVVLTLLGLVLMLFGVEAPANQ